MVGTGSNLLYRIGGQGLLDHPTRYLLESFLGAQDMSHKQNSTFNPDRVFETAEIFYYVYFHSLLITQGR